jgi:hypothetical protein
MKLREELEAYLVGTVQAIDCPSLIIRTVEDHLHCLGLRNLAPLGLPVLDSITQGSAALRPGL